MPERHAARAPELERIDAVQVVERDALDRDTRRDERGDGVLGARAHLDAACAHVCAERRTGQRVLAQPVLGHEDRASRDRTSKQRGRQRTRDEQQHEPDHGPEDAGGQKDRSRPR
jgi:hypothetical protein